MDLNKLKNSMQRIENSNKPRSQKILERLGANFNNDGYIVVELKAPDGTQFDPVTYDAYKAIEGNTLDSYKPKTEAEKNILNNYRNHLGFELKTQDGTSYGKVSYDAYNAIANNKVADYKNFKNKEERQAIENYRLRTGAELTKDDGTSLGFVSAEGLKALQENNFNSYTPVNDAEKQTMLDYLKFRQEKIDNYKKTAEQKLTEVESQKTTTAKKASKLRRSKAVANRTSKQGTEWEVKDTRTAKEKREGKPIPKSEGEKKLATLNKEYKKLDDEAEILDETIHDIDKYVNLKYGETGLVEQAFANYSLGRLNQDTAAAYNDYIVSRSETSKLRAEALSAITEQFAINNKNALVSDDEGVSNWWKPIRDSVATSFAGYLPQLVDQTKASIKGAADGAVTFGIMGSLVPGVGTAAMANLGSKTGWVLGATKQMYATTRGAVFKSLLDAGYDEATALAAAQDEAFISSIIEGAGEILTVVTMGTGKGLKAIAPNATKKIANSTVSKGVKGFVAATSKTINKNTILKTTKEVSKVFLNAAGEYAEEYTQEAVSIANERRLANNGSKSLLDETLSVLENPTDEMSERLHNAGTEGFKIGLMMGGGVKTSTALGAAASNHISNAVTGMNIKSADANESGIVQSVIDVGLQQPTNTKGYQIAEKLSSSDKISSPKLGKLSKAVKGETVNVGEMYYDTKNNSFLNVVGRDDTTTTVTMVNSDGIGISKEFANETVDNLTKNNRYVMVANDTQTTVEQTSPEAPSSGSESTISVGDSFEDTKDGTIVTVTGIADGNVHFDVNNGETTRATQMTNSQFQSAVEGGQIVKMADTTSTESEVETTTPVAESVDASRTSENVLDADASLRSVYDSLVGEQLGSSAINKIINTPELRTAFEQLTGQTVKGSKSEQRAIVRDFQNDARNIAELKSKYEGNAVASDAINETAPTVFETEKTDEFFETATEAVNLDDETDVSLDNKYTLTSTTNPGNGKKLWAVSLNETISKEELSELIKSIPSYGGRFSKSIKTEDGKTTSGFVFDSKPTTEAVKAFNDVVQTESAITKTSKKTAAVVDAVNETLEEGALEAIYESMPSNVEKSLGAFAEKLIKAYQKTGSIGHIAKFFADGGKKVISAIESTTNADKMLDGITKMKTDASKKSKVVVMEDGGSYSSMHDDSVIFVREGFDDSAVEDSSTPKKSASKEGEKSAESKSEVLDRENKSDDKDVRSETPEKAERKGTDRTDESSGTDGNEASSESTESKSDNRKESNESDGGKDSDVSESEGVGEEVEITDRKEINLKRVGKNYEVYGEDAKVLAEAFELETEETVVDGKKTDVFRLPADLAEGLADAMSDEYNLIMNDKAATKLTTEQLDDILEEKQDESVKNVENATDKSGKRSLEREDNYNEHKRTDLYGRSGRRGNIGSTQKQTERISYFERKNKGKDAAERQRYGEELLENGKVEVVSNDGYEYALVKSEDYNDDMLSMVEEAKSKGVRLGFFIGEAVVSSKDGDFFVNGIKFNNTSVLVRYDAEKSPQLLAKHEISHAKWNTPAIQKIKNIILKSLTKEDKSRILSSERMQHYQEIYKNDDGQPLMNIVWEEYVCDVMSGMVDDTANYIDVVTDYWYGNEAVDSYNVAEYAESIDAGGETGETKEDSNGSVRFSAKTKYNEYNSLGMKWAYNSSTEIGDLNILYKPRIKKYVLVEATKEDVGFIELKAGTYKQLREDEKIYESNKQKNFANNERDIDTAIYNFESGQKHNTRSNVDVGNRGTRIQNAEVLEGKSESNKATDTQTDKGNLNDNIRYSFTQNSNGNTLTEAQQEYFKDSQVRDENGNLIVVYHGTRNNDFTVFNRNHNYYTDNKGMAESYAPSGAMYEGYLNITKPYTIDANGAKWSAIPVSEEVKKMLDAAGSSTFKEGGKWCTSVADIVSAISDLVDEGDVDYDGVIVRNVDDTGSYYKGSDKNIGNDYITFKSEQFKNTDNLNPTSDPDIRYSLAEEDAAYMDAVENGDMDTAQKMVDEVAKDSGYSIKAYHGTPNNDFTVFDKNRVGKGTDQYGAGFYFASNADAARAYGTRVIDSRLLLEKPLKVNGSSEDGANLIDAGFDYLLTQEQAYEVIKRLPNIYDSEESPLGDYYDSYWESGAEEWMIEDLAANESNRNIGYLDSDLFRNYPNELHEALRDVVGYDGVEVTFANKEKFYVAWFDNQMKSGEPVTYDDKGKVIPLSKRFDFSKKDIRYDLAEGSKSELETQKKIESIAKEIGSHDELITVAKENTKEFVGKIKENKSLQKRLHNAKRQMLVSPNPIVNAAKAGKVTKDILNEMNSTLKSSDLKDEVIDIYTEYFAEMKKAGGVESKTAIANENMMLRFASVAVDIADSAEVLMETEEYSMLKSYIQNVRIKVPDSAKSDVHYAEFRKANMGTFNLTNDGLSVDVVYAELCELFPGMFDTTITNSADQLLEIADKLESLKPYAYNPHENFMEDTVEHIVYRFVSEADGLAAMPKTKAQKMAEKSLYDKEMALEKERASFERKLEKQKEKSETKIQKLQKKIDDFKYTKYWENRLDKEEKNRAIAELKEEKAVAIQRGKEEKARAVKEVRERRDVAILKTKIRNIVSDLKKNIDKTEKAGGYPKELVKAAAEVCSALDFHTDRPGKRGEPNKSNLRLDALKMEYDALKKNGNYDFESEYSEELSDKIEKLHQLVKDKRVIDLGVSELSELKEILSEISHRLSVARKQIGKAKAQENAELALDIINTLESKKDVIDANKMLLLKQMKLAAQSGKAFVFNPHRINEMIAGYDKNSVWWQLYDEINRGSRKVSKFVADANKPFDELVDGGGNEIAFYDFRTKKIKTGIKYADGSEVEIPKSIICELMMMWERKAGRTHLASGGASIPDIELYNKGLTIDAIKGGKQTKPITQADIARLRGMLDSYDLAWIENSHNLFDNVAKDAINTTSMELLGREIAKGKNYIRIFVDNDFVGREVGKDQENITIEGHGSLKETVPEAKQPIVLRGLQENVYDHIDFVSKYYGLAIPIRNFNKVYRMKFSDDGGQRSVQKVIGQKFGAKIQINVVEQFVKDLQAARPKSIEPFGKIRGNWLTATFWGNISSMLKQTSSYWTASSILSEASLAKGLASYVTHRKQTKAEIGKYSGTLYKRSQGLSTTELGDRANRKRLAGASSKVTKAINKYAPVLRNVPEWIRPGNWLQSMDCAVSSALWDACKVEVSKTMKPSDEGYMKSVTDLYESVIEETQSNYDVAHRPEALKNTNAIVRTITMFQTDNLQQTGIIYNAFGDFITKSKAYKSDNSSVNKKAKNEAQTRLWKATRSRVYSSVWLVFVTVVGQMLLRKFKPYIDDEEKEITSNSVLKQAMLNMADDMFGVFVPVGGELISKAMDTFTDGYDFVTDPSFETIQDFIEATSKIWDEATDEEGKGDVWGSVVDAIPAISNFTGIPAKNISDLFKTVKGYAGDIKAGEFAHDLTDYTTGNKSFYSNGDLAASIINGNKEKEKKILDYYSANGKEIAKSSLTEKIKPVYVQLYIDAPEKAKAIKRQLILEYDYSEDSIGGWAMQEYLKNIVEEPGYAEEIKATIQKEVSWTHKSVQSDIKSYYKKVYKDGDEKETKELRNALLTDGGISDGTLSKWEHEADKEVEKKEKESEKEKARYE